MVGLKTIGTLLEVQQFLNLSSVDFEAIRECFDEHFHAVVADMGADSININTIRGHHTTAAWVKATTSKCRKLNSRLESQPDEDLRHYLLEGMRLRQKTIKKASGGKRHRGNDQKESEDFEAEISPPFSKKRKPTISFDAVLVMLRNEVTNSQSIYYLQDFIPDKDKDSLHEGNFIECLSFALL